MRERVYIYEALTRLMKSRGMSDQRVAELIDVTPQAVFKWGAGISSPSLPHLMKLCAIFGVSVEELIDKP